LPGAGRSGYWSCFVLPSRWCGEARIVEPQDVTPGEAEGAVLGLLAARAPDATICPSEAARRLAAAAGGGQGDWRHRMPAVHAAVDRLLGAGRIALSWKGQAKPVRSGPYRIGRGPAV
jgi:hypothetical protein